MTAQPAQGGKGKRTLLYAAIGCLVAMFMCCGSGVAGVLIFQSGIDSAATDHAEYFLTSVQGGDYAAAMGAAEYYLDSSLNSPETFQRCIQSTALADMSGFQCTDTDGSWFGTEGVDVICNVTSVSRGSQDITIHVNSPDDHPYLGFIWFSSADAFGAPWNTDECSSWSGREYYHEPPAGRVRP